MIDDIHDRVEALRVTRKIDGLRGMWLAKETVDLARLCSDYLSAMKKQIGLKPSTTEVIHLALQEFKENYGIMTKEEMDELLEEADIEDRAKK